MKIFFVVVKEPTVYYTLFYWRHLRMVFVRCACHQATNVHYLMPTYADVPLCRVITQPPLLFAYSLSIDIQLNITTWKYYWWIARCDSYLILFHYIICYSHKSHGVKIWSESGSNVNGVDQWRSSWKLLIPTTTTNWKLLLLLLRRCQLFFHCATIWLIFLIKILHLGIWCVYIHSLKWWYNHKYCIIFF